MYNPYYPTFAPQSAPNYFPPQVQADQMEVKRVSGAPGVDAFQMPPRSSILLLDSTAPIVWLVQTDDAGYKTKTPYKIEPYVEEPAPNPKILDERLDAIDARLKALEEALK